MERQLEESGGLKQGFFQIQFANPKHFTWLLVAFASMGGLLSGKCTRFQRPGDVNSH
jgi:hypothetical protein